VCKWLKAAASTRRRHKGRRRTLGRHFDLKLDAGTVIYTPGPGIELAGQALNKNAVAVMPKNQLGWYNSVIADDFIVQILETRIHMFLGWLRTGPARAVVNTENHHSAVFIRM
jgi:hypothetical protein